MISGFMQERISSLGSSLTDTDEWEVVQPLRRRNVPQSRDRAGVTSLAEARYTLGALFEQRRHVSVESIQPSDRCAARTVKGFDQEQAPVDP